MSPAPTRPPGPPASPPRSYLDSRADGDQIDTPSHWTLPGQRHWPTGTDSVPALVIAGAAAPPQQIDLTTLHPLAHRMGEALELLAQWADAFSAEDVMWLRDTTTPATETRALLRAAGLLPQEPAP